MFEWYTIFTQPRKEFEVAKYFQAKGVEVYHPTLQVKPVNPRASKIRPYFPRYLFVYADIQALGLSGLKWIPGSIGLVEFGGEPATLPEGFIEKLHQRIAAINEAGGLNLEGLKKGDLVSIASGPFEGYEGIFDHRLSAEDRVQVLLHWMGREMRVKLNANVIEKRRRG
jgi:transcription antitermination factor NusG